MNTQRFSLRLVSLTFVGAAMILAPTASSQTAPPYADRAGDSSSAADITGVTVASDKGSGQIVFVVSGSNLSTSSSQITFLAIDSDANPVTGNAAWNGADYAFGLDASGYAFVHWNGSDWVAASNSTVRVCCVNDSTTKMFSVNRSELGGTSEFNFMAETLNTDTRAEDKAPDDGTFNYSLDAGGPDIEGVQLRTTPTAGPRAGKTFVVRPGGLKLPPSGATSAVMPLPDTFSCKATINGHRLRGKGTGGCALQIAKKRTRGKKLSVVVTVAYEGATKSVPFTFVVS